MNGTPVNVAARIKLHLPLASRNDQAVSRFNKIYADMVRVLPPFLALLVLLLANKLVGRFFPAYWILIPVALSAALSRVRQADVDVSTLRLWQFIGLYSAIYSVIHYPLMPLARSDLFHNALYALVLVSWVAAFVAGIFCFRIPSLALLPPAYLAWSNSIAAVVAGFGTTTYLDVQPLPEVSMCIGIGILLIRLWPRLNASQTSTLAVAKFAALLPIMAISIHLANYFWSFMAKMRLDGPFGSWVLHNNPVGIYLAALDDGHFLFTRWPSIVRFAYNFIDGAHVPLSWFVLLLQAAAIVILLAPKRALVVLLVLLDCMHFAIIIIAGANFWPWIILNIIITVVVAGRAFTLPPLGLRLLVIAFMLISPKIVFVAQLGWFDAPANNKLFFQAVDESGGRHDVPANFFHVLFLLVRCDGFFAYQCETGIRDRKPARGSI